MVSCIRFSMAMKAGLAFAAFFWAQRAPFQSFLADRPGSWCVPTLGQSRFAGPRKMNRRTRTCAFPPRSGDVRVSNSCVVRKSVFSGHVQRGLPPDFVPVSVVSVGGLHTCAMRADGQLVCFGGCNVFGQRDVPADLGPVLAVSAGLSHTCAVRSDGQLVCFGHNDYGQCDVPADLGPVLAVSGAIFILVQCGQMVSSSALDVMVIGRVTCQQIWDQFWQSQRAVCILVQFGQMASSSALNHRAGVGGVTRQQIWDQFWPFQQALRILVQSGQMVSSYALDTTIMDSVTCQQIWDQFWQSQGRFLYLCSAVRWSARLLWTKRLWTV